MPKARTVSGMNAIRSANSIAMAPASRPPSRVRSDLLRTVITREPHRARKTSKHFGSFPLLSGIALAGSEQAVGGGGGWWGKNAAMAVVVTLIVLMFGPQIAVTKFAKAVFNGCVRTTWTAVSVPFELDVLHVPLPTVKP